MCYAYCSIDEVAGYFGVHKTTIENKCVEWCKLEGIEGHTFSDLRARYSAKLQLSLRRKQIELALGGSVPMLIFLGKECLGQENQLNKSYNNNSTWEEEDHGEVISQTELVQLLRGSRKSDAGT